MVVPFSFSSLPSLSHIFIPSLLSLSHIFIPSLFHQDYDAFDNAVEEDTLEEFLKLN